MTEPAWKARISAAHDDLRNAEDALAAATARRDAAREEVTAAVRAARPTECEATQEEFLRALRPLYWEDPTVSGKVLAAAAGFRSPAELTRAIGSAPSGVPCASCGKDIPRTSRSSTTHVSKRPGDTLCPDCDERSRTEGSRIGNIRTLRKHYVDTSPVTAAAWEWEVATRLITAYPPVATNVERDSPRDGYDGTWQRQKWAESLELRVLEKPRDEESPQ